MDPPGAYGNSSSRWRSRNSSQVCRYLQQGLCFSGDYCSYQHLRAPSPSVWAHHYLEPQVTPPGPRLQLMRRNSLPTYLPSMAGGWGWGWTYGWGWIYWDSEPGLESLASEAEVVGGRSRMSSILSSADRESGHSQEPQAESDPVTQLEAPMQTLDLEGGEDSQDVVCGICMDRVWNKPRAERVFGILPNCAHAHCLSCLRTWRMSWQHLPWKVIKACPQCRVHSSYIIPHKFWVSQGERKEQLVRSFKARTSQIPCRFFIQRNGRCPFRSECIYLHQRPHEAPASAPSWSLNMHLASRSEVLYPMFVPSAIRLGEPFPFYSLALTGRGRGSEFHGFLRPGSS